MTKKVTASDRPSVNQFFTNPHQKGTAAQQRIFRENLNERFKKLMDSHSKKFSCVTFEYDDKYYFHVKHPSEAYPDDVTYDMLVEFDVLPKKPADLTKTKFRVYTNYPAFVFTQAYVFGKTGMIIEETAGYLEKALKNPPDTRNPMYIRQHNASVFFAITYILTQGIAYQEASNFRKLSGIIFKPGLKQYRTVKAYAGVMIPSLETVLQTRNKAAKNAARKILMAAIRKKQVENRLSQQNVSASSSKTQISGKSKRSKQTTISRKTTRIKRSGS